MISGTQKPPFKRLITEFAEAINMNTPDGATFKRPNLHMFCRLLSYSGTKNNSTIKNIDVIKLNNVAKRNASAFFLFETKIPKKT